ncbi:hypothetical protein NM688_g6795 [Phlebia brevispora]|uniref:Uncharacterized protein n=1 Tax=Phlebia brevispora TaxID=194682 RepID=A0ACC1SCH4_9APHY|nr:hypothetical protein NM688_g6795 [Phlebia brevispora]
MPKRPPTPTTDPTGKYLTVHQPYPLEPNMELLAHQKEVAFWISNCLGNSRDLTAMYHKPRSDKVILEIKDTYENWRAILGEHRWDEMLKNPSKEEKGKCSQIFYCRFNHDRDVQKHGWKRIDIKESWYREWTLRNGKIVYPYPVTKFCNVPPENPTSEPLCRPLPVQYWPRPMPSVEVQQTAPVPGSLEWQKAKQEAKKATTRKSAWAKGPPASKPGVKLPVSDHSAWKAGPPGLHKPNTSNGNTNPWNRQQSSGSGAPSPVTPFPPKLNTAVPTSDLDVNATSELSCTTARSSPPGLVPSDGSVNGRDSSDNGSTGMTPLTPEKGIPFEEAMAGLGINGDQSAWLDEGEDADGWGEIPMASAVSEWAVEEPKEPLGSLWDDYENEEEESNKTDEIVCAVHVLGEEETRRGCQA